MANTEVAIPAFQATPIESIKRVHTKSRETFRSAKTKDVEYRILQLRRLYWGVKDNTDLIVASLAKDMHKSAFESMLMEVDWCLQDCLYAIKNLKSWVKDEKCQDVPLQFSLLNAHIRKDPLGVVLIIGSYNFPILLTFSPLIGAIAAGCPAVIKPSELSTATAMAMEKIVRESLDPDAYAIVNGAIPETTELLDLKWDKIFYTGGGNVGTIVATKAAKTLTPVTLELGGRNPAFITRSADLRLAARRLMWGKTMNAGQVCLSHNYILIDRSVLSPFIQELKNTYKDFFPEGAKKSPDYSRIVNRRHFLRIKQMLDDSTGKVVLGGDSDENELYIEPTAVQVDSITDTVMAEESFGPLFGLMPYTSLDEAINIMNDVDPTPLALFVFGSKEEQKQILNSCLSGGASMNDSFFHASVLTLPFGGVGSSGTGAYRGKESFETFTHRRTITTTPSWIDKLLRVRYMPYSINEYKRLTKSNAKPDFDRTGQVVSGGLGYWIKFVVGLGGSSAKGDKHPQEMDKAPTADSVDPTDPIRMEPSGRSGSTPKDIHHEEGASQSATDQLSRATTAAGELQK